MFPVMIDSTQVDEVKHWWNEGRGITSWQSLDLSNVSLRCIAPTDNGKPHWRYGEPKSVTPSDIGVEIRTPVAYPLEWFPECTICKGTGERSLQSLADLWKVTLIKALERTQQPDWDWGVVKDGYFQCNGCKGTGREHAKLLTVRVVRLPPYKGGGLHAAETQKISKMREKLRKHYGINPKTEILWDWEYYDNSAPVRFFTAQIKCLAELM